MAGTVGLILFVVFIVLLVIGAPIGLALAAGGVAALLVSGDVNPLVVGQRMFGSLDSLSLIHI